MSEISNHNNTIDSHDIIKRIDDLRDLQIALDDAREERKALEDTAGSTKEELDTAQRAVELALADFGEDEADELKVLEALQEQAEGYCDWKHGEALIRDSYFETYAQELAADLGLTKADVTWPFTCIDWDQAAAELKMDYTAVDFDGVTYWVR